VIILLSSALILMEKVIDKNMNDARVYMASGLSSLGMFWFLERLF
jgi:hypothetical protein